MSWAFQDRPGAKEVVERMLSTAVWAPNHRLTEPWRFFVVNKDSDASQGYVLNGTAHGSVILGGGAFVGSGHGVNVNEDGRI